MAWRSCDEAGDQWFMENAFDTAVLTGASVGGLEPKRLQDPRLGVAWRTPTGGAVLQIDFPSPVRLDVFAVFGFSRLPSSLTLSLSSNGVTWDVRSGQWTPEIDTETMQAIWLNSRDGFDPAPQIVRIALAVADQMDIGRIWAGPWAWAPQANHINGAQHGIEDLSFVQRTKRSGAVFADKAAVLRTADLAYDMITDEEMRDQVFRLGKAGRHTQMLFIPDHRVYPIETFALLGYQEPVNPITAMTFDRWSRSFVLKESG